MNVFLLADRALKSQVEHCSAPSGVTAVEQEALATGLTPHTLPFAEAFNRCRLLTINNQAETLKQSENAFQFDRVLKKSISEN